MAITLKQVAAKVSGLILYTGPSEINGQEIIVIATGLGKQSTNIKTGDMVQIWIMAASQNPVLAYKAGEDAAVCGDCKHGKMGTCYVNLGQGPYAVFDAYKRGKYDVATPELIEKHLTGRYVRFGAYGDPAAVPVSVWEPVLKVASRWTAYTHQWGKAKFAHLKSFCMASVDNQKEYKAARNNGWRTFRIRLASEQMQPQEFVCPASHEAGQRLTCQQCMACNGNPTDSQTKGTVTIVVHGTAYKPKRFIAVRERQMQKKGWKDLIPANIASRPVYAMA